MLEATRAKLISAARAAFTLHGYAASSMDDLTADAGLTRGALYHHFKDKKGLLQAVIDQIDAEMLARMYTRWAEKHGFKIEFLEESQGEEAGIKSATIQISGHNAYGWLKTEAGVATVLALAAGADVMVESFRPGVIARLGKQRGIAAPLNAMAATLLAVVE